MFFHNQLKRDLNALGARRREFTHRDHFHDSNDIDFTKDIAKSFADRCKSRPIIQRNAVRALGRTKMTTFRFRKVYFSSYDESDVSKRFSRQSRSDLPLRSSLRRFYHELSTIKVYAL